MSKIDDQIQQIKTQFIGNTGARVLLVEGPDDVDAYRIFLDRKFSGWERYWQLAPAGNKKNVVGMAGKEPAWLGLVDCDEWSDADITEHTASCPNLMILPRFCLESYLVDPAELWAAFPEKQRNKIVGGEAEFRLQLLGALEPWIRHAALWHGVQPLWRELRIAGFPTSVLGSPPMPDDVALRAIFSGWHQTLDAAVVLSRVHTLEVSLAAEDVSTLCAKWLYAKNFYPQVVQLVLNRLLGQKDAKERRIAIFRARPVPDDLDIVWRAMGLQP